METSSFLTEEVISYVAAGNSSTVISSGFTFSSTKTNSPLLGTTKNSNLLFNPLSGFLDNYTELLFPSGLLKADSVIGRMISEIPEE